jgi:RHS repeat-associated protein
MMQGHWPVFDSTFLRQVFVRFEQGVNTRLFWCPASLLTFIALATQAFAGTFTAFGPKTYTRQTGDPVTVSSSFSVLNPNTEYTLHIQNSGVSSAVVSINGIQILRPDDFQIKPATIDRVVTLQTANRVDVQLRSEPGSSLQLSITGVDTDPPVISASASPAPDSFGWNNTNVVVTFTCSDQTSGIASCPAPVTVSTEGARQTISGTATDRAGNTASASKSINLDKTAPTIAGISAPPANSFGWNNTGVTINFACADALSGIATCTPAASLLNEGANQAAFGTAVDKAGNSAGTTALVNIDMTPPAITASSFPAANAAGWNNTDVTVSFLCSDLLSGVAVCPAKSTVITEGANQIASGTATDKAGNSATASATVSVDKTLPSIAAGATPAANSAGWNNSDVTVAFTCSDALSGVASCTASQVVSTEGSNQIISGSSADIAGNTANTSITINLDKTPPVLSVSTPSNGDTVSTAALTVTGTASDSLSGIAGVACNGVAATLQAGSFSCALTLTAGLNPISVIATDVAGNMASQSLSVILSTGPAITGFTPQAVSVGNVVTISGSGFSPAGSPPQMTLAGQNGGTISAPVAKFTDTSITIVVPSGAASGTFTITVGGQSTTSATPLTIVAPSSFTLAAAPAALNVIQGQSSIYSVALSSPNGFNQLASLSVAGVPAGVTAIFSPQQISAGQTAILTVSAPAAQSTGSSPLVISASASVNGIALTQTASVSLNLQAIATSFIGRTTIDDGPQTPLRGVKITFLGVNPIGTPTGCIGQSTTSDEAGNFSFFGLPDVCAGEQLVAYDGSNATTAKDRATPGVVNVKYAGVDLAYAIVAHQVSTPSNLIRLPRIDDKETVMVAQNDSIDQTFIFKTIPGLSVTVYAGTVFTLADGSRPDPFPLIAVNVPVDRLPDEMPGSTNTVNAFIVAFQPANAVASQPVAVSFPNTLNNAPNTNMELDTLNPSIGMMVRYGSGTVSNDGTQIVPDFDPAHPNHRFGLVHFDWHGPAFPTKPAITPPPPPCIPDPTGCGCTCDEPTPPTAGDNPVDLSSGLEVLRAADIRISGPRGSIFVERTYRTLSNNPGPFGIGTGHNFSYQLAATNILQRSGVVSLVLPDGNQLPFNLQPEGTWTNTTVPVLAGAVLSSTSPGVYTLRWKHGTTFLFRNVGLNVAFLNAITDANGNTTTLTLNSLPPGQIARITAPVGRSLNLAYDSSNRIVSITDPIGRAVLYSYNAQGTLATVTDPAGGVTKYDYDLQNRLTQITDQRGVVVEKFSYDATGRVAQAIEGDGGVFNIAYTLANAAAASSPVLKTVVTDPLGNQTTYRFNALGLLTDVTDAAGQTRAFLLDPERNFALIGTKGAGACAVCGDTAAGDQRFTHDASGNMTSRSDALGNKTLFSYEPVFNKVASVTDPLGHVTSFTYDSRGNMLTRTDANGNVASFSYNSFGQVTQITDALGNKTAFSYDGFGNLATVTDPLGNASTTTYDGASRPVETVDALGNRSQIIYDALDRVTRQVNAQRNATQFAYDLLGNLLSVTDARSNTTSFTYDAKSRLLTKTDPLGKSDSRTYDLNGNLVTFVDRRGQTSQFTYDPVNRLIAEKYVDATVSRAYDQQGRLVHIEDSQGGIFDFSYDVAGRLLGSSNQIGAISYTYDAAGQTLTRQVAGMDTLQYAYDAVGNMTSAALPQASASLTYDPLNRTLAISRANGVISQHQYDAAGRLLSLVHSGPSGVINALGYSYDAVGNRTSYTTNLGQPLITQPVSSTFDAANRLVTSGGASFSYDANGNLASTADSTGTTGNVWDSRNRLQSILGPVSQGYFQYDVAGNLISQSVNGRSRLYVIDNVTNIAALNDNGDMGEILSGRLIDQHLAVVSSGNHVQYALADSINSTTATVDGSGAQIESFFYEPFGRSSVSRSYPFQYTGRIPTASNLYSYRARFYESALGRFISEDPIKGVGGNRYRYVYNNPVRFRDPTGKFVFAPTLYAALALALAYNIGLHYQEEIELLKMLEESGAGDVFEEFYEKYLEKVGERSESTRCLLHPVYSYSLVGQQYQELKWLPTFNNYVVTVSGDTPNGYPPVIQVQP